jgi:uncharacterized protein YqjF (DUF2071 family)
MRKDRPQIGRFRGRPWVMRMRWVDLLFAHWPMAPEVLRPLIPADLEIDTFDGRAWLGIVPFRMEDVAPRGLPAPPIIGAFPELNVRTYVTHRDRPGVWFLSLDAASRLAVEGARRWFHLPYVLADMTVSEDDGVIEYRSVRRDDRMPPARLVARYRATGPIERATAGSIEAWFTERWRLFALTPGGRIERTEIRHAPWPLQPASAEMDGTTALAAAHGLQLPNEAPHLRMSRRLDVVAWWPRPS